MIPCHHLIHILIHHRLSWIYQVLLGYAAVISMHLPQLRLRPGRARPGKSIRRPCWRKWKTCQWRPQWGTACEDFLCAGQFFVHRPPKNVSSVTHHARARHLWSFVCIDSQLQRFCTVPVVNGNCSYFLPVVIIVWANHSLDFACDQPPPSTVA